MAKAFTEEEKVKIKEKIMDVTSVFDNYGHHENLESRYSNLCIWLSEKLKV